MLVLIEEPSSTKQNEWREHFSQIYVWASTMGPDRKSTITGQYIHSQLIEQ